MPDDQVQLACVVSGQRGDDDACLAGALVLDDVPFTMQPLQRAANGRAAQTQPLGDLGFDDPRTRGQIAVDDELAELLKRASDTAPVLGGGRSVSGSGRLAADVRLGAHLWMESPPIIHRSLRVVPD